MSSLKNASLPDVQFKDLGLSSAILKALDKVGYQSPSPIQAATIGPLLAGENILGQAQTGTGKTAAFALPILSSLKPGAKTPQVLVLAPTRELAIQVADAFKSFSSFIKQLQVVPIYGGQSYVPQLKALKRGVDIVVATPGRVMDHIKRGTLKLDALEWLVLDEADEMLQMGFIDDVEWIFANTPATRQVALFSATMPKAIRRIAQKYLHNAKEITIESPTITAANIRQRYWRVGKGISKFEALTRLLEAESFDATLIFARTKKATAELATKLITRGYACAALNGDVAQAQRERTIVQLKNKQLDIIVATDVAARGLDVDRISHVINYDIPHDPQAYTHRIGRTGRAGRSGEAILFITGREQRMLKTIERTTGQPIEPMDLPSIDDINVKRVEHFQKRITQTLAGARFDRFKSLITDYQSTHDVDWAELSAALAHMAQGPEPLLLTAKKERFEPSQQQDKPQTSRRRQQARHDDTDKETFLIHVGHQHGAKPRNIVGAIANEAGLESQYIGRIDIRGDHSLVDLPKGMPDKIFEHLKKVWVANQQLRIKRAGSQTDYEANQPKESNRKKKPKAGSKKRTKHPKNSDHAKKAHPVS